MHHVTPVLTLQLGERIIDRAASMLPTPLSIADCSATVLASSRPGARGKHDPLAERAVARGILTEAADGSDAGIGVPLSYDDIIAGAIVLHAPSDEARIVAGVIRALAELMIHQAMVIEHLPQHQLLRDKLISDLVRGGISVDGGPCPPEAAIFGIDLVAPRIVVAVDVSDVLERLVEPERPADSFPEISRSLRRDRARTALIDRASVTLDSRDSEVYGFIDDRWLVFLAQLDRARAEQSRRGIVRRTQLFLDDAQRTTGGKLSAGVGRYHGAWWTLPRSFIDATTAAEEGASLRGPGHAVTLEELGLVGFLAEMDGDSKHEMAARLLLPLCEEPALLETLAVFFRCDLSPSAASSALSIHRHTLGYRLDKIHRLTGYDPRRFEPATQLYASLLLTRSSARQSPAG